MSSSAASGRILICFATCLAAGALELPPGEPLEVVGEPLIDLNGHSWTLAGDGSLGREDEEQRGVLQAGGRLVVDNRPIAPGQAQLVRVPGESEPWTMITSIDEGPLLVVRFIQTSRPRGWCRWLEVVSNRSGERRHVALRVQHQLLWPIRAIDWRRDDRHGPISASMSFGNRRMPGIALWWGEPPRLSAREGGQIATLEQDLDLDPGEAVGVVHALAVRPQADMAAKIARDWSEDELGSGLPWIPDLRLINVRRGGNETDALRAPNIDIVITTSGERLAGTLMTAELAVQSDLGRLTVSRPHLAGLARRTSGGFAVYLDDGQAWVGGIGDSALALALPTGDELHLSAGDVRLLAMRSAKAATAPGDGWELRTVDRQRIFTRDLAAPLTLFTALDRLSFPASAISAIDNDGVVSATLSDGGHVRGLPDASTVALQCRDGRELTISWQRIRSLHRFAAALEGDPKSCCLTLRNGDSLHVRLTRPMAIATRFHVLHIETDQLRSFTLDAGSGQAMARFADGAVVQGWPVEDLQATLPWGATLTVPATSIASLSVDVSGLLRKRLEDEARTQLGDLGDSDGARVQAAGTWLAEHRTVLRDFLATAYDGTTLSPTARHRLGLIIGKEF